MTAGAEQRQDRQLPAPRVHDGASVSRLSDPEVVSDASASGAAADRPNGRGGSSASGGGSSSSGGHDIHDSGCVHQLFERQASARPEAVCLIAGDHRLSYGTANALANQLARRLADAGVTADVAVGVSLPKSVRLYISLLAVLKAGGCYVPLDRGLPPERAAFMLKQAGARMLLADLDSSFSGLPSVQTMHVGDPMAADWQGGSLPDSNLPSRCMPADMYSITYTR